MAIFLQSVRSCVFVGGVGVFALCPSELAGTNGDCARSTDTVHVAAVGVGGADLPVVRLLVAGGVRGRLRRELWL